MIVKMGGVVVVVVLCCSITVITIITRSNDTMVKGKLKLQIAGWMS